LTTGSRVATAGAVKTTVSTQGASSIVLKSYSASATIKAGEVFTVADCYSVNPQTRESTGSLQQFVVTADATADGSGDVTVSVSPAIYTSSQALATVDSFPTADKTVTFLGSASTQYPQNLVYHRDAITFVSPEMELPGGMDMAAQSSLADEGSISLRFVRGFDILNNRRISRFDVLWGAGVLKPEWCVRRTA